MNKIFHLSLATFFAISSLNFSSNVLAGVHGHGHEQESHHNEDEKKGPNGGRLLEQDNIVVEVTIYETDVPPEMRLYVYQDGELINPNSTPELQVTLGRLGDVQDKLTFRAEQDYFVSEQTVVEPHSYDVTVKAKVANQQAHWHYASHEGRATIANRLITQSDIQTETISSQTLKFKQTLFGVIEPVRNQVYQINAPYAGLVEKIFVTEGQQVKKGQALVQLYNSKTLKSYTLKSPAQGEVSNIYAALGQQTNQALLEIADLSQVWAELSAFPEAIEQLQLGQQVEVYDMHKHERSNGEIIYIAPLMTGGHIARARTLINNSEGHWRPGMHIKADVITGSKQVEMAVKNTRLQKFRDMDVVFAEYSTKDSEGQLNESSKTYEVRMLELGDSDDNYTEVLGGIAETDKYVTNNSYLLKADVLKDGASHDH